MSISVRILLRTEIGFKTFTSSSINFVIFCVIVKTLF